MRTLLVILIATSMGLVTRAQTRISGTVSTERGSPLANVNIMIKNSYDGISSDSTGHFSFTSSENGNHILLVSSVNYNTDSIAIELNGIAIELHLKLKERYNELDVVTITAGVFEAGDSKKGAVLSSLDVATTAGATADIFAALQTLPGRKLHSQKADYLFGEVPQQRLKPFLMGCLSKHRLIHRCRIRLHAVAFLLSCLKAPHFLLVAILHNTDRLCRLH